jgi:hypothetical protein
MKNKLYLISVLFICQQTIAQLPEDAIRMSWVTPSGSARNQAIGGAMGSLGGDITSIFVNPAGLGLYKTNEIVLSPGFSLLGNKSAYRGTDAKADMFNRFNFGASGVVWGFGDNYSKWNSKAFGIAVNRTANFDGKVYYKGQNDFSSYSEQFVEFAQSGLPIDAVLYNAPLSLGTKLANYTYLIDTLTVGGQTQIVGLPYRDALLNNTSMLLNQEKSITTKGGITEIAIAYAANMDDKVYIGGSIGVPIVNYNRSSLITETDATGINNNNFNYSKYDEEYTSKGVGVNAKLGIIIKPTNHFRLGLAIHTPSIYGLKEKTTGRMENDLENYFSPGHQIRIANTDSIYTQFGVDVPQYKYDLSTPWKFIVSGSLVLREESDVTKQRGFLTADIEYVTHRSSRFSTSDDQTGDDDYYKAVNNAVKSVYKGAFNFRAGGELKFKTIMTRLGFAYYGNPYKDKELKAHRMNVSGGLGWRNKGMFIDLTYVESLNKDVNFPYRLSDKANTFADIKEASGNVLMTVGFKF